MMELLMALFSVVFEFVAGTGLLLLASICIGRIYTMYQETKAEEEKGVIDYIDRH